MDITNTDRDPFLTSLKPGALQHPEDCEHRAWDMQDHLVVALRDGDNVVHAMWAPVQPLPDGQWLFAMTGGSDHDHGGDAARAQACYGRVVAMYETASQALAVNGDPHVAVDELQRSWAELPSN